MTDLSFTTQPVGVGFFSALSYVNKMKQKHISEWPVRDLNPGPPNVELKRYLSDVIITRLLKEIN